MGFFKKLVSLSWTSIFSDLSTFAIRFLLFVLFGFLLLVILRGLRDEGYQMQAFEVPKKYHEAGYNGSVIAYKLQEKVNEYKILANSQREDSLELHLDMRPDLNLDVMGVGLSASSVTYHLKELIGRETYTIAGHITDLDQVLTLNMRMTDFPSENITIPYPGSNSGEALEEAIQEGAKYILKNTDPYRYAVVLDREGDTEGSLDILRAIVQDRPQDRKWAYLFWGNIKSRDDEEAGDELYLKALEEDPNFILPMRTLAWRMYGNKDYEGALEYFERALEIDPTARSMHNGAALCHKEFGQIEQAEKYYKMQLKHYPNDLYAYGNYSWFLKSMKKDTLAATKLWETASQNIPISGDSYISMAQFHLMNNDTLEALRFTMQALEVEPDNVSALSNYTNYLHALEKNYVEAEKYARRWANATQKGQYDRYMQLSAYNMLAMTEYEQAKFDSSIVHANYAISLLPEVAMPYTTLAEANLLRGNMPEFYAAIAKAIELGYDVESILDDHPYDQLEDQSKVLLMIADHKKLVALKG